MRLRTVLAALLAVGILLTFESSAFAQRRGGWGGYNGWGNNNWNGGWGGYNGWGYSGWGYGNGIYGRGWGVGIGDGYYGRGSYPYYGGSYYYPSYNYYYPDTSNYYAQPNVYDATPSTSYYQPQGNYGGQANYNTQQAQAGPPQNVTVNMNQNSLSQNQVTVTPGSKVTWTNETGVQQTVTSDQGIWDSGPIPANYSYNCTFNRPGTYSYHSNSNPNLRGTIIVR